MGLYCRSMGRQILFVLNFMIWGLDCKEIQPVHSEGNQPWDFFGRNDAKAEIPIFWPPHDSLEKTLMLGGIGETGRRRG